MLVLFFFITVGAQHISSDNKKWSHTPSQMKKIKGARGKTNLKWRDYYQSKIPGNQKCRSE